MYRFLILGLFLSTIAFAQPKATVQFFGGYSLPLADMKGHFGDSLGNFTSNGNPDTNTYFLTYGINYGISFKKPLFLKNGNFNLVASIIFNAFGQSKDYSTENVKLRQNILSLALGAEWEFAPKKAKINPFAGIDIIGSIINGSLTETFPSTVNTLNLKAAFRIGFMLGGGVDFVLHQNVGMVIGAKYAFANLIGKDYAADFGSNYNLGDKEHTIGNAVYPAKNIKFIQFYGGVSFYFGR
jgi:outer membrane protein W